MRKLMIEALAVYGWRDYGRPRDRLNHDAYIRYLEALPDDELLATYTRMIDIINNLD